MCLNEPQGEQKTTNASSGIDVGTVAEGAAVPSPAFWDGTIKPDICVCGERAYIVHHVGGPTGSPRFNYICITCQRESHVVKTESGALDDWNTMIWRAHRARNMAIILFCPDDIMESLHDDYLDTYVISRDLQANQAHIPREWIAILLRMRDIDDQ